MRRERASGAGLFSIDFTPRFSGNEVNSMLEHAAAAALACIILASPKIRGAEAGAEKCQLAACTELARFAADVAGKPPIVIEA
jgi:hypothetical protein